MSKARDIVETLRTVLVDGDVTNANFTGADLDIAKGGTGASSAGAARTSLGLAIGSDVQAFNSAIMVDGDIGTTVQAHDADTAKLDANANFTGTLQRSGTNVLVAGDVNNANFTGADLEIGKGGTGSSSAGAARTALGLAIGSDVLAPNGSAANLTNLPAGGNVVDFVASGTLPNGSKVILKSNGQVEVVAITTAAVSPNIPAGTAQPAPATNYPVVDTEISFDPNTSGKFVIGYRNNTNGSGNAFIGTLSGTSLSFGSVVQYSAGDSTYNNVKYNPNVANQFIATFKDGGNNNYGMVRIGTVSGSSISYGTAAVINSGNTHYLETSVDTNTAGKFVSVFRDAGTSSLGMAIVGTISGSGNISDVSSESNFEGSATTYPRVAYDISTANKYLVTSTASNGNTYARVGTISGSSTSYGTRTQILDYSLNNHYDMKSNPNVAGQFLIITQNSSIGKAYILTVSGTGVSIGTAYTFSSDQEPSDMRVSFDPNTSGAFAITYRGTSSYQWIISGNIVGSNIIFQAKDAVTSAYSNNLAIEFDPATALKFVTVSTAANDSFKGFAVVGTSGKNPIFNLTSTNFLGTSTAAYTNGQTATIMLQGGVSTNQSSLAIGSTYYVQIDGTLATSADSSSGAPSVIAGKAVKANTLLLKGI